MNDLTRWLLHGCVGSVALFLVFGLAPLIGWLCGVNAYPLLVLVVPMTVAIASLTVMIGAAICR